MSARLARLLVPFGLLVGACGPGGPVLVVEEAWSRPTAADHASAKVSPELELGPGVAYVRLRNDGDEPDRLVRVSSPLCRSIEVHRTEIVDGRGHMQEVEEGVPLPAGETVAFDPGGLHLMLLGLGRDLVPGDRIELVLEFERSPRQVVESTVVTP